MKIYRLLSIFFLGIIVLFGLISFLKGNTWSAPFFSPEEIDLLQSGFQPPLSEAQDGRVHWLGTDQIGRDVLAGLIKGCEVSLSIGISSVLISLIIGLPLGVFSGWNRDQGFALHWLQAVSIFLLGSLLLYATVYFSLLGVYWGTATIVLSLIGLILCIRWDISPQQHWNVDAFVMRWVEIFIGLPGLLILMAISGMVENKSIWVTALIIGILRWPVIALIARNETIRAKKNHYMEAADALGISIVRKLTHHILPNIMIPIMVTLVLGVGSAILIESALSFLGLGAAVEQQTWGSMLAEARKQISAWWIAFFPGMAIFLTVLSLHYLGKRFTNASAFSSF